MLSTKGTQQNGTKDLPSASLLASIARNLPEIPAERLEQIDVTNFNDLDLSFFTSNDSQLIDLLNYEPNLEVGRVGEQMVFQVLKRQYPNAEIQWLNEHEESLKPYDIYIKFENGECEYVEVKTTSVQNEKSFFISSQEIQFIFGHPENSSIYRVYRANPIESSTITKISRLKENLDGNKLKLIMTIYSKSNESAK